MEEANEIILYQPNSTFSLDVRVDRDTVWLTQAQIAELFGTKRPAITKHLANIFKSGELNEKSTCSILEHMGQGGARAYETRYYNLDAILSVGYRVNSINATKFRQWANKVLKDYLLKGYAINQRMTALEDKMDRRIADQDRRISQLTEKVDFFVRSSLPPKEGVFFNGQIFEAYALVADLFRRADKRIVIIDNYVDDTVLVQLSKRKPGVRVDIYSGKTPTHLLQDVAKHNEQFPGVTLHKFDKAHDRFVIIDEEVFHIGASLKDLGKKLFAFAKMEVLTGTALLDSMLSQ